MKSLQKEKLSIKQEAENKTETLNGSSFIQEISLVHFQRMLYLKVFVIKLREAKKETARGKRRQIVIHFWYNSRFVFCKRNFAGRFENPV